MNPLLLTDGYKTGHQLMYPKGTTLVYSNFTPRSNKYAPKGCDRVVSFGQQYIMKFLHETFQKDFFDRPKDEVCGEMKSELSMYLNSDYDVSHFEALHDLGYLPIEVKALPEGTLVPIKVPVLTIKNTHPDFYWITNYLETIISNLLWKPVTSATIAFQYKKVLTEWAEKTNPEAKEFVLWQGHDFSMRGMDSIDAVVSSGLGHLTSFFGTDSLPTIHGARKYYGEKGFVAGSVPATEHSVMSAGTKEDEVGTFRRLLTEIYPSGILSVVSDTWNIWKVCTEHVVTLREEIMARDGKLVIRPDSGDPADILCGYNSIGNQDLIERMYLGDKNHPSYKGVIELLWDVFGGTTNEQGYKVLDPHIGAIYGDSITIDRANEICKRLEAKGFASTNVVLGVGSFTYQYNTRDTFGFAMKATYVEVKEHFRTVKDENGNYTHSEEIVRGREISKDPITDDGTKKSATGLLSVFKNDMNGEYELHDRCDWETEKGGELKTIYSDGNFSSPITLSEIREKLVKELELVTEKV
jgi:nicotinamide phosphoribosyltransferase